MRIRQSSGPAIPRLCFANAGDSLANIDDGGRSPLYSVICHFGPKGSIPTSVWVSGMKKADLDEFRRFLVLLRARIRGDVQTLTDGALEIHGMQGDSRSPTHLADLGTDAYEQDFALRRVENEQEVLDEIESALERVDNGTFGQCEGCLAEGKSPSKAIIPKARLRALPYARNCVECERKREQLAY